MIRKHYINTGFGQIDAQTLVAARIISKTAHQDASNHLRFFSAVRRKNVHVVNGWSS